MSLNVKNPGPLFRSTENHLKRTISPMNEKIEVKPWRFDDIFIYTPIELFLDLID